MSNERLAPFPSKKTNWIRLGLALMLATGLLLAFGWSLVSAQDGFRLLRATHSSDPATRDVFSPEINYDGSKVVFYSDADYFNEGGIYDNRYEVWLYDTATLTLTRITDSHAINRNSLQPDINANGTKIVFHSDDDFLSQGSAAPDDQYEIWLYDTTTTAYTRITTSSLTTRDNFNPSINYDGTKIAFHSSENHLGLPKPPANMFDIWLYDTVAMTYTRVTSGTDTDADSNYADISGDGTRIVFQSGQDLLNEGLSDDSQIWLFDTTTMTLTRVTTSVNFGESDWPRISGDGSTIVFRSDSDMAGESLNNRHEVWTYDIDSRQLRRLTNGGTGDIRPSQWPTANHDGSRIAFASKADFLNEGLPNIYEIWVYDEPTDSFNRVTQTSDPTQRSSDLPVISGNGQRLAFLSDSDFKNEGILLNQEELWLARTEPVFELTKSVDDLVPAAGTRINYTVRVTNTGLAAGSDSIISDTLDPHLQLAGPITIDPASAGTVGSLPTLASSVSLGANESLTVTLPVTVMSSVGDGTWINNTATISDSRIVTESADSVALLATFFPPQLEIAKSVDDKQPQPGQEVTFQFIISNTGNGPASGVVLSDILPAGLSFVGPVDLAGGSGGSLAQKAGDLPAVVTDLTIAAGETVTVTLPVKVDAGLADGTLVPNLAEVTSNELVVPAASQADLTVNVTDPGSSPSLFLPIVILVDK